MRNEIIEFSKRKVMRLDIGYGSLVLFSVSILSYVFFETFIL